MPLTADPVRLFTARHAAYERFIRAMRYPQGLRAFLVGSPLLRPQLRALDAGCGTGALTLALHAACTRRGFALQALHAFDLTPVMLDQLRAKLRKRGIWHVELAQANVLDLGALPRSWGNYDLIVSAAMLEYVPRERLVDALTGLHMQLNEGGAFVLFITRRNPLTRLLIGRWWQSNLYTATALKRAFQAAGFSRVAFRRFPLSAWHLSLWGHIVEGHR